MTHDAWRPYDTLTSPQPGLVLRLAGERRVTVIRSPRSKVSFFSLGDFEGQVSNHAVPADIMAPSGYTCKPPWPRRWCQDRGM